MTMRMIAALALSLTSVSAASAGMMSDREKARAQAEHLCYDDVQRLCNAAIPDEARIESCMSARRTQLSPGCRKVFDAGLK